MGAKHYKLGDIESIDLYKSEGSLHTWAICEARHHLARNLPQLNTLGTTRCIDDMDKVIHYAEMIKCISMEVYTQNVLRIEAAKIEIEKETT